MENNIETDEIEIDPAIAEIKKYPGYENISDKEALKICEDLKELSIIFYNAFARFLKN